MTKSLKARSKTCEVNYGSNGSSALRILHDMFLDFLAKAEVGNYDASNIAWFVAHRSTKARRARAVSLIEAVSGMTVKEDAKAAAGYKVRMPRGEDAVNRMDALGEYVEQGVDIMSDALCEEGGLLAEGDKPVKPVKSPEEMLHAAVAACRRRMLIAHPKLTKVRAKVAADAAVAAMLKEFDKV